MVRSLYLFVLFALFAVCRGVADGSSWEGLYKLE